MEILSHPSTYILFLEITVIQLQMQHVIVSIGYRHGKKYERKKKSRKKKEHWNRDSRTTISSSSALDRFWNKLAHELVKTKPMHHV